MSFYESNSLIQDLNSSNFNRIVIESNDVWVVEFYAPWCGHCKNFAPEFVNASEYLKGVVRVGAVDGDQEKSLMSKYGVTGFPTILLFGLNKDSPKKYESERSGSSLANYALRYVNKLVKSRIDGSINSNTASSSSNTNNNSKNNSNFKGSNDNLYDLKDSNFDENILNSSDLWLVMFYAPWCGHCKNLKPTFIQAAQKMSGKVKFAMVDATKESRLAQAFSISGYPTLKYYTPNMKIYSDFIEYNSGRSLSDLTSFAEELYNEFSLPPVQLIELTSYSTLKNGCPKSNICIIAFLPKEIDSSLQEIENYKSILENLLQEFRKKLSFFWVFNGSQTALEEEFGLSFGFPTLIALNFSRRRYSVHLGAFNEDSIREFLQNLATGNVPARSYRTLEFS